MRIMLSSLTGASRPAAKYPARMHCAQHCNVVFPNRRVTSNACRISVAPAALVSRLDALLSLQAVCRGQDCYSPYSVLHPDGSVTTFAESMDPQYDDLYGSLPRYHFKSCTLYYYADNEGGWFGYNTTSNIFLPSPPPPRPGHKWQQSQPTRPRGG